MKTFSCSNCGGRIESQDNKSFCAHCGTAYIVDVPPIAPTPPIVVNVQGVNNSIDIQRVEIQVQQARLATEYMALDQKTKNLSNAVEEIKKKLKGRGTLGVLSVVAGVLCWSSNPGMAITLCIVGAIVIYARRSPLKGQLRKTSAELVVTKQRVAQLGF